MNKGWKLTALLLVLLLMAGCSSIAPREKTIILSETSAPAQEDATAQSGLRFEVSKIVKLPLDKLALNSVYLEEERVVAGWIDEDNLIVISVQLNDLTTRQEEQEDEEGVEQPTERVVTQFARINYQYGFYDPVLTLTDVAAECFDISDDGTLVALVVGNRMEVYSLLSGTKVQSCTRQVLASRVTFAQEGHEVYFTAAGDVKQLEALDADSGVVRGVQGGKSYRALAASEKAVLLCTQSGGEERLGYLSGEIFHQNLLVGDRSSSSCILATGEALVSYGGALYLIGPDGVQNVGSGVTAFDIGSDDMHIAYALRNENGTVDVRVGYWGGSRIINDKLAYKDLDIAVDGMYFSPDMRKLYLQGYKNTGVRQAYTFEFR